MPIRAFRGMEPQIDPSAYIEASAVVLGEVSLAEDVSIWCNATLRGDVGPMRVGARSNIQDNCVVHQTRGLSETVIGEDVTVGHGAILHGCRLHDRVLVGMGAIVMDNAEVASDCLIGAGSLIPPGKRFLEPGWLIHGRPARPVRKLTPEEVQSIRASAEHYRSYVRDHRGEAGGPGPEAPEMPSDRRALAEPSGA